MKKKIGAILLAGAMACTVGVSLSACGKGAAPDFVPPEDGFDTTKDVTITFYHQMGGPLRNILDGYIEDFEKMYPNIHIDHSAKGDWDTLKDTIVTELQGGNHPNIAYCYADHVADYNVSNAVQPLDDFLANGSLKDMKIPTVLVNSEGSFVDEEGNVVDESEKVTADLPFGLTTQEQEMYNPIYFDEGYKFGDGSKMYTLPWAKSTEVIFYNKTFFDNNGLEPPKTWDEMETLCEKIKTIDKTAGHVPFGYDSEENWFITMCEQQGSDYTSSEKPYFRFVNDENKAFVNRFKGWLDKGYFTTSTLASTGSNTVYTSNLLLDQTIYMSIGSTGGTTYNVDLSGKATFDVGIAPIPQLDPDHPKMISQGPSVCIFKDSDPQKVMASWLFVKYMTTNASYQTEVSMNNGYMPVLKEDVMKQLPAYDNWVKKANGRQFITALGVQVGMDNEDNYFVSPAFAGSSDARTKVGEIMQQVFAGTKTIDQAFKTALDYLNAKYPG